MIRITQSDELAKLISALAADIGFAHDYWRLREQLIQAFTEHPLVQPQSHTFWSMTGTALESCAILHLCRVFDQEKTSLHLLSWLLTIQDNLRLFSDAEFRKRKADNAFVESLAAELRTPDPGVLKNDILECSVEDPVVKRLMAYRGSALAHQSAKNALGRKPGSTTLVLQYGDIPVLLARADTVLNRYSSLFAAEFYSQSTIGQDDYMFVIQSIESEVRRRRAADGLTSDSEPLTG